MSSYKKINVLVFPCGSENANEIYQSLRYSIHVNIIGASSVEDHGRFRYPNYISNIPNINDDGFYDHFSDVIHSNNINVVFATHDTVAEKLSLLASRIGFFLVNGDSTATRIARKKSETYALFQDCHWVPHQYKILESVSKWPVIIKPDMGQGGLGIILADSFESARSACKNIVSPVIVEYLPGSELTVDCFTNHKGDLVWIGPRTRERVRAGITMRSQQVELGDEIKNIANTINKRMVLRGPWFFQLKGDRLGKWKLLEVSCRISGTMVFQRAKGINLPLMAIHDYMGRDIIALPNNDITLIDRYIATRAKVDREYKNIYIDLDDTLIINGYAVPKIINFIYQSILEGKRIYLITRHEFDINETLVKAKISPSIFNGVFHIKNGEKKSRYIQNNSIFIDNHFPERKDVYEKTGCLVLDVDSVELFIK
ncbi:ATP-grasp domain-containing protein [Pectobacterium versatile]|uniref:Carbamoyl-phosphate synthase large subunit n=1 Tax=Pectobacterium odoriferum TaxID=78398 RepID=A0ABD6VJZ5_9GAMM|nr:MULTISPECIES: ATP-grasp domain-containing protein [Pectobacterium]MBA0183344.1 ATP-grasp domain-containing protein [Pectobacterium versatile]MCA5931086.1 ATP-grasp domain-containing protein [Pectobacterium versatile]MCA5948282.1 ATP-grasp domain-containing protein [Pectobacterium versatile]MCA5952381.1 ATP-grasp domain-containing protein [Pectobacterium versatile]MCL6375021.1 ATP-grasp domain-containing protein [Pectobacterium atrosepticum]